MKKPLEVGWTTDDVEKVIERGIPEELLYVPIFVSMNPPDCQWAEDVCLRLSSHQDVTVRGNAVLGFGHLARTCGRLNKEIIKPLIEEALRDNDKYVRGQAACAAEDTRDFLGWNYSNLEL